MSKNSKVWTQEEDNFLMIAKQGGLSSTDIAKALNRSICALETRYSKLNRQKYLSEEEVLLAIEDNKRKLKTDKEIQLRLEELTKGEDYSPQQLLIIKDTLRANLNPRYLLNPQLLPSQMKEIFLGLRADVDVALYASVVYDCKQMTELRLGLEHHVDISWYTNPQLSCEAMRQIRYGLETKLEVQYYASPMYNCWQMLQIREALKDRLPVWKLANPAYDPEQMKILRMALKSRLDISSFADPSIPADKMKKMYFAIRDKYRGVYPVNFRGPVTNGESLSDLNDKNELFVVHCKANENSEEFLQKMEDLGYQWGHLKTNSSGTLASMYFYCDPKKKHLYSDQNKPKDGKYFAYLSLRDDALGIKEADPPEDENWVACSYLKPDRVGFYVCLVRNRETNEVSERMIDYRRNLNGQLKWKTEDTVLAWRPHVSRAERYGEKDTPKTQEKEQETFACIQQR